MVKNKRSALLWVYSLLIFISCHQPAGFFESLPASYTNIHFANNLDSSKNFRILYFFYYYNGGGVSTGDVNNDGLPDIYFTANSKSNNKLYINKGNFQFEDITQKAGVAGTSDWCSGVTFADVNADGYLDIYVSSVNNIYKFEGHNELFINNKNETFTEASAKYGLDISAFGTQSCFFDYDHDGDLDCYILNQSQKPEEHLFDTSYRRKIDVNAGDRLMRNDIRERGKFTDVSFQAGIYQSALGYGLGISVADMNNDGWEDIYIGNDFHENDYYYLNNGNGTFSESGEAHFNHYSRFSMGNDISDYDNDGQPDIITTDMLPSDEKILKTYGSGEKLDIYDYLITRNGYQNQYSKNCLQRNNGNGYSFSDVSLISNVAATDWSWSPLFADFDNDGFKDLFISSGIPKRTVDMDYVKFLADIYIPPGVNPKEKYDEALKKIPDGASHNFVFKGYGNKGFEDKSEDWGFTQKGYFTGAAYADFDNDGDLDIAVNPIQSKASIYKNNITVGNYVQLKFTGDSLNTFGIGTKAWVFQKDKMQYQQLMLTRGFQSSSFTNLHFGLDTSSRADSILIVWPDQTFQILKQINGNRLITIQKKDAFGKFIYQHFFPSGTGDFITLPSLLVNDWKPIEDPFDDFNVQYLIPHQLSKRGPKLAVADVNKDGLDDFYVCTPIGQPGSLFIQLANGKFISSSDSVIFSVDAQCEDTDASFFDANGDGWPDLYVVSGGSVYRGNNSFLQDRLYLNDGKGHFSKTKDNLPAIFSNKSCVSTGDIDDDNDIDIFVGTLPQSADYGVPQSSYLLLNNGKGVFTVAEESYIKLKNIGMVTSSAIADINKDGRNELVVTGEWMPIKIFENDGKKLTPINAGLSGLWQTLKTADLNGDGFMDMLAGNWGLNSKLSAGKNGPLKLYVKDFDNNGKLDPILAYTINKKEYPFLGKDEIEQVLPFIKKKFPYYSEYAGETVDRIFDIKNGDVLQLSAETLASAVFINDGKGKFQRTDLPQALQLAPIMSFTSFQRSSYIAAGNFYGVIPYEGRYDALFPTLFTYDKSKEAANISGILPTLRGEVRDTKWISYTGGGKVLIVARNNQELVFLKPR